MSLAEACGYSFFRSSLIAAIALPLAVLIVSYLVQASGRRKTWVWVALLIPYFCPELLVGYTYSNFALRLIHHPPLNELVYSLVVMIKLLPVAALVLHFSPPPPLSSEAFYCRWLAIHPATGRVSRLRCLAGDYARGPARTLMPAWTVVFLLAFQEFEIASLMGVAAGTMRTPKTWTVWLFDKQAGGLLLSESLRFAILPLAIEVLILAPVLFVVLKDSRLPSVTDRPQRAMRGWSRIAVGSYLVVAILMVCVVPLGFVLRGAASGLMVLLSDFKLTREIVSAGSLALVCGVLTCVGADFSIRKAANAYQHRWPVAAVAAAAVPGLLGSLLLSLALLALFQTDALHRLYDTPLPLVLALILFLLPRALLLGLLLRCVRPGEPIHSASILRSSRSAAHRDAGRALYWELNTQGYFWTVVLLFVWAYWELSAPALLAPTGFVTAPVRLYNLMHYGHSAVLSSMLAATIAFPIILLLLAASLRRPILRWLFP